MVRSTAVFFWALRPVRLPSRKDARFTTIPCPACSHSISARRLRRPLPLPRGIAPPLLLRARRDRWFFLWALSVQFELTRTLSLSPLLRARLLQATREKT